MNPMQSAARSSLEESEQDKQVLKKTPADSDLEDGNSGAARAAAAAAAAAGVCWTAASAHKPLLIVISSLLFVCHETPGQHNGRAILP